jgi:secondary thiamine-phosphate synthase enzyme
MGIFQKDLQFKTKKFCQFIDITEEVEEVARKGKVKDGIVLVYSPHTTAAIRVNEKEKGIVKDFEKFVKELVPDKIYYHHNDLTERTENLVCEKGASDCLNGHSHVLHLLMGATSETLVIENGKLILGTFQRIFLIELDCARKRKVKVLVMGE